MIESHKNPLLLNAYNHLLINKRVKNVSQLSRAIKFPYQTTNGYITGVKPATEAFIKAFEEYYELSLSRFEHPVDIEPAVAVKDFPSFVVSKLCLVEAIMTVTLRELIKSNPKRARALRAEIKTELKRISSGKENTL